MKKSLLVKVSLFLLFLLAGEFIIPSESAVLDCDGLEVQIQTRNTSPSLPKGSVDVSVSGAQQPIYYIFYNAAGQLLSKEFNSGKIVNIDPGTYYCSIVDGKGCIKKSEFKIE